MNLLNRRNAAPWTRILLVVAVLIVFFTTSSTVFADEAGEAGADESLGALEDVCWGIAVVASIAALIQAFLFYKSMMACDEGTPKMIEIAGHVREGAAAYLRQQYKVVFLFFVVICALLAVSAYVLKVQSHFVPFD